MSEKSATPTAAPSHRVPFETAASLLGSPSRWRILAALLAEPQTSSDLARHFGMSVNAVGKHLKLLHAAGVVALGRGRVYSIAPAMRTAPGPAEVDLGPCIIRLDQVR